MSPALSERLVSLALRQIDVGSVSLRTHDGVQWQFRGALSGPEANVRILDPHAATRVIAEGSVGMAAGYIEGEWETPDLLEVLRCGARNLRQRRRGLALPASPANWLRHRVRDNDLSGSKRNIAAHYDLGNDFYRLWLDPTMAYSCALFLDADDTDLQSAQLRKFDSIIESLHLGPADRVLEIGCGWGGFAVRAAEKTGCSVVGITLSEEQHAYATRLASERGVADRVEIRLQDYRNVAETFSKVVSIEMFEAVGMRWWPTYFKAVYDALEPGGTAAIQVITIDDERLDRYANRPDFIQLYIFPGGMLPSPEAFERLAVDTGFNVGKPRFFGWSYAKTLQAWREAWEAKLDEVRGLGFDENFIRMWRYYFDYCQAGFEADTIDVMQVTLRK